MQALFCFLLTSDCGSSLQAAHSASSIFFSVRHGWGRNLLQTVITEALSSPTIIPLIFHMPCPFTSSRWNYQSAPLVPTDPLEFHIESPSSHVLLLFQHQSLSSFQLETQCPDFIPLTWHLPSQKSPRAYQFSVGRFEPKQREYITVVHHISPVHGLIQDHCFLKGTIFF